jgi:glyoxylase-like metal-dependent hydrolase (beta-lactamase superfamily II)
VLIGAGDQDTLRRPRPSKGGDASPVHVLPHLFKPRFLRFMGSMVLGGAARPAKVDDAETFGDGDVLDVPGQPRVVATPGHTPGHCVVLFERHGALFVGDELCTWNPLTNNRGPQVLPSSFNVDTNGCFESLAALEPLDAAVVLPGHGEPWRDSPAAAVARAREAGRS